MAPRADKEAAADDKAHVLNGEEIVASDAAHMSTSNEAPSTSTMAAVALDGNADAVHQTVQANLESKDDPASDEPWYNIRSPINLEAKDKTAEDEAERRLRIMEGMEEPSSDEPWYNIRSPINLEAKADAEEPWYNIRSPLNLEAKDSVEGNGAAAQPWWDVRTALNMEAKEAKQLVIGAGQKLESLTGGDQLHLLVGGSMLLVAGVVVNFVRRARNRKAAEKELEDETYLLMA